VSSASSMSFLEGRSWLLLLRLSLSLNANAVDSPEVGLCYPMSFLSDALRFRAFPGVRIDCPSSISSFGEDMR
jgi:hypothetical protein